MIRLFLIFLVLLANPALANFSGLVVAVTDGDTIKIMRDGVPVKVRLKAIDAPESCQSYGREASSHLAALVFSRDVVVVERGLDKYGRTLGFVSVLGVDVNAAMVADGYAWVYLSNSRRLKALEASAREAHNGLWADPNSEKPSDFRKRRKCGRGK